MGFSKWSPETALLSPLASRGRESQSRPSDVSLPPWINLQSRKASFSIAISLFTLKPESAVLFQASSSFSSCLQHSFLGVGGPLGPSGMCCSSDLFPCPSLPTECARHPHLNSLRSQITFILRIGVAFFTQQRLMFPHVCLASRTDLSHTWSFCPIGLEACAIAVKTSPPLPLVQILLASLQAAYASVVSKQPCIDHKNGTAQNVGAETLQRNQQ